MELLMDALITMDIMEGSYDKIKILTMEGFTALLGTLVDQWAADHGMNSQQACEMLRTLCEVQEAIHSTIGTMP
ncbi:MAG: hypothetical protein IIZ78_06275, partial [Clostridiales bacterium]|nr:hypothetical protein [Clostridiales bacterium]